MEFEKLAQALAELDEPEVMAAVQKIVEDGGDCAYEALEAFHRGMEIIGDRFDRCEYFVADLIFVGTLMTQAVNMLRPVLRGNPSSRRTDRKVVICTVESDLHDIGKNIVKAVLEGRGINVFDLGVNISPDAIVEKAIAEGIRVVALSGVLSFAKVSMKLTVDAFANAGIRDEVKIIVGGACVNESTYKETGADAWSSNPKECADICSAWLELD